MLHMKINSYVCECLNLLQSCGQETIIKTILFFSGFRFPVSCFRFHTCDDHHADGEDLLVVSLGGDVAKADGGHARHGVVQRRHVHRFSARPAHELDVGDRFVVLVERDCLRVRLLADVRQRVQPTVLNPVDQVGVADGIPGCK